MFFCSISGEPPQDPVVSSKSGHVYERRLIQKYISENGTDPITGEKLEEADLIAVKANPKAAAPRPPSLSSIPTLLHTLQNEWDALVLETFQLKQQYNATRQELSYALYAQDASVRVVARLIKERDAAREALASVQASMGLSAPANGDVEMEAAAEPAGALPQEVLTQVEETHAQLSASRKKRKAPAGSATPAQAKTYISAHTIPSLHSSSPAGVTALAVSAENPTQFLTGGNDKIVQLYDRGTDKVLATLKGHTKKINRVAFRERAGEPTLLLSAGADKLAKAWAHDEASGEYIPRGTIRSHKGEVTGLAVHPTGTLAVLGSADGTYSIQDLGTFQQVSVSAPVDSPFASLAVHPDGALIGVGTANSTVLIYDLRSASVAATLAAPAGTAPFSVRTLGFSENGYQLLAPDSAHSVAVWDLRNQQSTHSFSLGDGFGVNKVQYDASAKMLGIAGTEGLRLFAHKTWEEIVRFEEGGEVADFVWGNLSQEVWGVTGREVRIWGPPKGEE